MRLLYLTLHLVTVIFLLPQSGCTYSDSQYSIKDNISFSILFFNDVHGHYEPQNGEGGVSRLSKLAHDIRIRNSLLGRKTFLVYGGDLLMGTLINSKFKGELGTLAFRLAGVDVSTIGNHEFDFGQDNLSRLQQLAGNSFQFISCNIDNNSGEPAFLGHVDLPLGEGSFLHVIGVTTAKTEFTSVPGTTEGLIFSPEVEEVELEIQACKPRGPIIVLSHAGKEIDNLISRRCQNLLAVIGAHDQTVYSEAIENNAPIFQAGDKSRYLGQLDCEYNISTRDANVVNYTIHKISEAIDEDAGVKALIDLYQTRLDKEYSKTFGRIPDWFPSEPQNHRKKLTILGCVLTDLMRRKTKADIALLNGGTIRSNLFPGDVSGEILHSALPYPNIIHCIKLKGSEIREVITESFNRRLKGDSGGFLQYSGLSIQLINDTVAQINTSEGLLNDSTFYTVAISDFLQSGGDEYSIFANAEGMNTNYSLQTIFICEVQSGLSKPKDLNRLLELKK